MATTFNTNTVTVSLPLWIAFGPPGAHARYLAGVEDGIIPYPEAQRVLDASGGAEFVTVTIPRPGSRAAALRLQDIEIWAIPYRGEPDRYMAVHVDGTEGPIMADAEDAVMAFLAA